MEMLLSLIQTSQNRTQELQRFISTLNNQKEIDLSKIEYIFIDQGNNKDIFKDLNEHIKLVYIKYRPCSLSHARNIGLQHVKGKIIAFPDDDCWYESDTLSKVLYELENNKDINGVVGIGKDENGKNTSSFLHKTTLLTPMTSSSAISYTMFFYHCPDVLFDESMGIGSPFNIGSGEETDYMLTLMKLHNYKVLYNPLIIIHHPPFNIHEKKYLINKSYSYARGSGYLMNKHRFPTLYYIRNFMRPLLGIIYYSAQFNFYLAKRSYYILKGRLEGYFFRLRVD